MNHLPIKYSVSNGDGIVYNLIDVQEKLPLTLDVEELEKWMTSLHEGLKKSGCCYAPIEALKWRTFTFSWDQIEKLAMEKFGSKKDSLR